MVDKTKDETSASNQSQGDDEPKYITAAELNAAITARFRSFETKQSESLSRIESLLQQRTEPVAVEPEAPKPSKKVEDNPLVQALDNKVKLLEAKNQKARETHLRAKLQEELLAGRVNPLLIKPLLAQFELEKTVSYADNDSDEIVFKTADSVFTLRDGVQTYLSSEDAKPFLSPKGAAGSGDKTYKQTTKTQGVQKLSTEQAGEALLGLLSGSGE